MPAVLLECGVIVNRAEEQDLNSEKYRSRLIVAIKSAIAKYADTAATAAKKQLEIVTIGKERSARGCLQREREARLGLSVARV